VLTTETRVALTPVRGAGRACRGASFIRAAGMTTDEQERAPLLARA
jgi:hypothetical protein